MVESPIDVRWRIVDVTEHIEISFMGQVKSPSRPVLTTQIHHIQHGMTCRRGVHVAVFASVLPCRRGVSAVSLYVLFQNNIDNSVALAELTTDRHV